jgi:anti-anti-sigma factor
MDFAVDRDVRPDRTVLAVRGELDLATVPALREAVDDVLPASPPRLHLDLSGVSFIDSTGCRELLRTADRGATAGVPVELVVPAQNRQVRRVLDLLQLEQRLPIHDVAPPA